MSKTTLIPIFINNSLCISPSHPKNWEQIIPKVQPGFVDYLEKENQLPGIENEHEFFFNQKGDDISPEVVLKEIDANTSKLKKSNQNFTLLEH
jgi:hypothetical protein